MFIVALLTIGKTLDQWMCPLADEWVKKMWYIHIYSRMLLSYNNEILSLVAKEM
jgi:hypothetical protein